MGRSVDNLHALDATEPYDVCVVGAGLAGIIVTLRCVQAGLRVLLLESDLPARHLLGSSPRAVAGLTFSGDTNYPPELPASRAWNGVCERFEPTDLRAPPYLPSDNPWPLVYGDLEPHYTRMEKLLRVRGGSPARGQALPPLPTSRSDRAFEALLQRFGHDVRAPAAAAPSGAAGSFNPRRELLPEVTASRTGALVSGVTVTRLRADRNGRIIGANCRTLDGVRKFARADTFVLCCGSIQTPRLLLLSRSPRFPLGIGNDYGRVGRRFTDQAILTIRAEIPHRSPLRGAREAHAATCHRTFRRYGLGAVHATFGQAPRIARPVVQPERGRKPAQWLRSLRAPLDSALTVACRIETKPSDENRITLSNRVTDPLGDPVAHLDFSYSPEDEALIAKTRALMHRWLDRFGAGHRADLGIEWSGTPAGTCRMGADTKASVCDMTLRLHASPNLYLCGAATFPIGGALPPALTVAAFADRLADHVIARARWCSRAAAVVKPRRAMPSEPAPAIELVRREPQS